MTDPAPGLFFSLFRKYRLLLLAGFLVFGVIAGYLLKPVVLRYKGLCTFHVLPDTELPQRFITHRDEARLDLKKSNKGYERVLQLMYSGQMMDYIINGYELYEHYGIDTLKPYYKEKAIAILTSRTEVIKINNEIMRVVVSDRNNEIAAAMANSMVTYLDRLNRKYSQAALNREIEVYKTILSQGEKITQQEQMRLEKALVELKSISARSHSTPESRMAFENMEFVIRDAASVIKTVTDERINAFTLYKQALEINKPSRMSTIVIIKRALPEMESNRYFLLLYAAFAGFAGAAVLFGIIYSFYFYRPVLNIMFGK